MQRTQILTLLLVALPCARAQAQENQQPARVWIGSSYADVAPDGSFELDGPTPLDGSSILGQVRGLWGLPGGLQLYGESEFFDLAQGQTYLLDDLVFFTEPRPGVVGLRLQAQTPVLTLPGEQTQLDALVDLSNDTTENRYRRDQGTQYQSSWPAVISVDIDGLVTAHKRGAAVITASNQGAFASTLVVADIAVPTEVVGFVFAADGSPAVGADVTVDATYSGQVGGDGSFSIPGVFATGLVTVIAEVDQPEFASAGVTGVLPVLDGFTDAGLLELVPRAVPRMEAPATFLTLAAGVTVVTADFDGDAYPDLAGLDDSGRVTLALNSGRGVLTAGTPLASVPSAVELVAGDFTGDGRPDLLVVDEALDRVVRLCNDGDGTFSQKAALSVGDGPRAAVMGDVDGDGDVDLLTADGGSSTVTLLRGDGLGLFGAPETLPTGSAPQHLALGDLDGDGDVDLVTVNSGSKDASVLFNDGAGGFSAPMSTPLTGAGSQPARVLLGDLDGDLDLDLAVCVEEAGADAVYLAWNDGAGGFAGVAATLPVGEGACWLEARDVDLDMFPDILVTTTAEDAVQVLVNLGGGSFAPPDAVPVGVGAVGLAVADFDADGAPDLGTSSSSNVISCLLGRGDGSFGGPRFEPVGAGPVVAASADLNGDSVPDLVTVDGDAASVSVLLGIPGGGFLTAVSYPTPADPDGLELADFDGDSDVDLLVSDDSGKNGNPDKVSLFRNNGDGTFAPKTSIDVGNTSFGFQAADLDGDADTDFALRVTPFSVAVYLNDGTGGFALGGTYSLGTSGADGGALGAGDLDGDGDVDLVTSSGFSPSLLILLNDGNAAFGAPTFESVLGTVWGIELADLDGDSDVDVAFTTGNVFSGVDAANVLLNTGTGRFSGGGSWAPPEGSFFPSLCIADVGGDGVLDAVFPVQNLGIFAVLGPSPTNPNLYVLRAAHLVPGSPRAGAGADFTGDSIPDLALPGVYEGRVIILPGR